MDALTAHELLTSVLYTAPGNGSTRVVDNNNHNHHHHNNNSNNNNNGNTDSSLNTGMLQTTDIQELHLLGLHFGDLDAISCATTETNNNHYSYTNNGSSFDTQNFHCPPMYDPKSEISWPAPPSNTDGAIQVYAYDELRHDNANSPPFWEDENLSPITTALNQSPYQNTNMDEHSPSESKDAPSSDGDYQSKHQKACPDSTHNDFESTSLLLRNALLGKTPTSRYSSSSSSSEKGKNDNFAASAYSPTIKQENQNEARLQPPSSQVYFLKQETATLPSLIHHSHAATVTDPSSLVDHQSVNMFKTELGESTDTPFMDEIVLQDFDSFSYSDEQFGAMNSDIAQAIQQICNVDPQTFISSYVPSATATVGASVVVDAVTGGGGGVIAPSTDMVTTNTVDPLIHNQIPTSSKARRPNRKSVNRLKQNNHSHRTRNGDISLRNEYNCTSNLNECSTSSISNNNGGSGVCSSSNRRTSSSTSSNGSLVNSSSNGNGGSATSSTPNGCSIGIRKERSLHHCYVCNKGFKDKYSVNVHIRTHTGEKPFSCSVCSKRFRQKAHLAKHQHTHFQKKSLPPSPPNVMKVAPSSMLQHRR